MLVISSGEFSRNQNTYFDQVDAGEEIFIQRGKHKSYQIVPVTELDTTISEEYILQPDADFERAMPFDEFREKALNHIRELYSQK